MDLFHSNGYLDIFSERSKFSKKIAMLKKILGMLRTKIERKSAPMNGLTVKRCARETFKICHVILIDFT